MLVKERGEALKLVKERPVVEKTQKQYVNDCSAPRVFLIGLVVGLGTGAAVVSQINNETSFHAAMAKIEATVIIDRPIEEVWKFMTDLSNNPKWDKNCVETKQTSTGPLGVGTTAQYRRSTNPKIHDWRAVEYEPNRKFSFEFTSGPMKGTIVTMTLETIEGKTRLTETDDYKISGFYRLAVPFMGGGAKREAEGRVGGIKRVLES